MMRPLHTLFPCKQSGLGIAPIELKKDTILSRHTYFTEAILVPLYAYIHSDSERKLIARFKKLSSLLGNQDNRWNELQSSKAYVLIHILIFKQRNTLLILLQWIYQLSFGNFCFMYIFSIEFQKLFPQISDVAPNVVFASKLTLLHKCKHYNVY